jgi:uncharacterized lipoprotein YajG
LKQEPTMKLHKVLILLGLAAALAACSDSPQEAEVTPPASNEVPASATVSTRAYATFAASLAPSDTTAPLDVNKVTPPTSEWEEPQSL